MVGINGQTPLLDVLVIESRLIEMFESVVTEIRSCFAWGEAKQAHLPTSGMEMSDYATAE